MKFTILGIEIFFPYEHIYPEQLSYIKNVIKNLSTPGNFLIEMPSGTGKTVALLSSTISFIIHCKKNKIPIPKVIYATRTVAEVEKAMEELKNIINFLDMKEILGVCLTSKRKLCVNESVISTGNIDLGCRKILPDCDFYTNVLKKVEIPVGVYNFEDIIKYAKNNGECPYYLVRKILVSADYVIYTYNYLIDPQIYDIVSKGIQKNTIIILDEAHNIDNYCIESLSFTIKRKNLDAAVNCLKVFSEKNEIAIEKETTFENKKKECISFNYKKEENESLIPGNLRSTFHFISACKRIIEFFKTKLKTTHLTIENPTSFINSIKELTFLNEKVLNYLSQRLSLIEFKEDIYDLKKIIDFTTTASLFKKGFKVTFEPFDNLSPTIFNPVIKLCCLDATIAISHIFKKYRNVIVTSGTLSPIDFYPKILGFIPKESKEININLGRNSISPLIVTKGNDQMTLKTDSELINLEDVLTSSFNLRSEPSIIRNYGTLILELSKIVPDGMVVFFPSYSYMEEIVSLWSESYFISEISKHKLIFVETPSFSESVIALENYKKCCNNGRGAILFSVARGKVSEGVDFKHGEGRCVILLGIPYQYTQSNSLKARLEFLKNELGIKENTFLGFDAMRHGAQCLGRVIRSKDDYGLMILADKRYENNERRTKLPKWILNTLEESNCNLSIDMATSIAKKYYREMGQEYIVYDLWDEEIVNMKLEKGFE